jgi:hypothetical protein
MVFAAPLPQPTIVLEPSSQVAYGHHLSGDYGTLCVFDDIVRIVATAGTHVPDVTPLPGSKAGMAQLAVTLAQDERELCALPPNASLRRDSSVSSLIDAIVEKGPIVEEKRLDGVGRLSLLSFTVKAHQSSGRNASPLTSQKLCCVGTCQSLVMSRRRCCGVR